MSALMDLFDKITSRRRDRELSAHDQLAAAAKRHVRGETVDVASIEEALHTTGQSVDDFRKLCDAEEKRLACFQKIEGGAASKTKLEKLEQQIAAESRKFAEIRSAYESRVGKLDEERRDVVVLVDAASAARDWLLDPRNVVGVLGVEYREALSSHETAEGEVQRLRARAKELRGEIKSADDEVERLFAANEKTLAGDAYPVVKKRGDRQVRSLPPDDARRVEDLETSKARAVRRLSEVELELQQAETVVPQTEARLAAIRKRLLQP